MWKCLLERMSKVFVFKPRVLPDDFYRDLKPQLEVQVSIYDVAQPRVDMNREISL